MRGDSIVLTGQVQSDEIMTHAEMPELERMMEQSKAEKLEWDFDKDLSA